MQRQIDIIGAAWGLGGADPGCAEAPRALTPLLVECLQAAGAEVRVGPVVAPLAAERRRQLAVSRACGRLAGAVGESLRAGRFPCVLGGDHSCAAGTLTGVARALHGPLGLLWIDAHMDSHTPSTSPSGRMHGMPLAWLLGEDDDLLYGLSTASIDPSHVCLVGVHSYEREEAERLGRLGVRVFFIDEVRDRGLDAVLENALAIATRGTAGYGVTIDLDAVAPEDAPGVGVPEPGGIPGQDLVTALARLRDDPRLVSIELVEYVPRLDRGGRTARLAVAALCAALVEPREHPQVLAEALHRHHS
jgi:arginase